MKLLHLLPLLCIAMTAAAADQQPASSGSATPASPRPLKVLAIGNSFSASLCRYLPAMADASGTRIEFCNMFIGGCPLKRHAENIARAGVNPNFAPYDITWFRDGDPAHPVKFKSNVPQMLATQKWDVVTLQQASHESWRPESFTPWADAVIATVRALAPDAEIVWHETWSYNPADPRIYGKFRDWPFDNAGMYSRIETNALTIARERRLRVIPVGLAVQKLRDALAAEGRVFDPGAAVPGEAIDLKGEPVGSLSWRDSRLAGDMIHLNRRGEYMQAATWLGFLLDSDVRSIPFAPRELGGEDECAPLRAAAQAALDEAAARGWQDFTAKKAEPPTLRFTLDDNCSDPLWTFVTPESGVVDAGTTAPNGPNDLCYAFNCNIDSKGLIVTVVTFDDDVSTDNCKEGSTSCPAWDDDAVEVFIDGEYARLPDSRADKGVHLKHGGEFSLVANGAAMSDFSGYPNSYAFSGDDNGLHKEPIGFGVATNALWTGFVVRQNDWRETLLAQPNCPAGFAPDGTTETTYVFYFSWAAMGRNDQPSRIGFNIGVQDDDGGGRRNHALYWTGDPKRPFSNESVFGTIVFE